MKKSILILSTVGALALTVMLISGSCNSQDQHKHDSTHEHEHDEGDVNVQVAYQCPMKCEGDKTYKEEGNCPKCKMDLVKVEEHSEGEHQH